MCIASKKLSKDMLRKEDNLSFATKWSCVRKTHGFSKKEQREIPYSMCGNKTKIGWQKQQEVLKSRESNHLGVATSPSGNSHRQKKERVNKPLEGELGSGRKTTRKRDFKKE